MRTKIEPIDISEPFDTLEPSDDLPPGVRWIDPRRDALSITFTEPGPSANRAWMVAVWVALAIPLGLWVALGFALRAAWRMLTG